MRKIVLLGYMGCGKSTIAKRLSKILGVNYVDLDKSIEQQTNLSISNLFQSHGEVFFRKTEREVLLKLLADPEELIIGLGGGTPCYGNNHELLRTENITSIYLKASVDTLYDRLVANKSKRPLLASKTDDELKEFIAKHLFERSYYYNQAQHKVVIDGKSKDETTQDIVTILKQ
jgi:shikimate kinase